MRRLILVGLIINICFFRNINGDNQVSPYAGDWIGNGWGCVRWLQESLRGIHN